MKCYKEKHTNPNLDVKQKNFKYRKTGNGGTSKMLNNCLL